MLVFNCIEYLAMINVYLKYEMDEKKHFLFIAKMVPS